MAYQKSKLKNWLKGQKDKIMGKYRIFNGTTKQEETIYGDSPAMLVQLYKSVGEDIEIREELVDDRKPPEPKKVVPVVNTEESVADESLIGLYEVGDCDTPSPLINGSTEPKYYTLGDQQLMQRGSTLYHKVWKDVENPEEYRIMSTKTGKSINTENKLIQTLTWSPMHDGTAMVPTETDVTGEDLDD